MISNITNNGLKVNVIKGASIEAINSSALSCLDSKNTAIEKATEASVSASSASASEAISIAKANEASVSASSSQSSATIATTKATSATTSEANALSYKDSASTSATVATTKADEASISASSASASASSAFSYNDSANISATTATTKASEAQLSAWEAEAEAMTSESYATEAVDVFVKEYTSNGNGTFTVTNTTDYSALHWSEKSKDSAQGKAVNISYDNSGSDLLSNNVQDALDEIDDIKANKNSPVFTGTPTAPTPTIGDNSTQLATTEFVTSAVANPAVYQGAYGFNWDYSTDTYVRTGAAGYTSIQTMMKRCVLNANGTVNYYLHPTNSNFKVDGTPAVLTGADGNVMVQVPKFYVKIETVGNVDKYSISLTPDVGYVVHPWFIKAGVEVDYRYYRAYTGYNSGGTLKSISGVTPTRTQTIATFRSQAMANGTGWHLTDWNAVNAIKLLCYIEFADYIVTDYIGTGNDTGADYGITTGQSNAIGNASSPSTNSNTWMSYRGIENFYADCWEFLDGVNINNYVFYVNQNYTTFASDVFTGDYVSKGTTIAASALYIRRCAASVSGGWIPSVIGGASTTYYGDGFWSATGARVACFGGGAGNGAIDGAGALGVNLASSFSGAELGGAVCF